MPNGSGELVDGAGAAALLPGDGAVALPPGQIGTGFISPAMVPS
jgi:hypothetical protein